MPPNLDLVLKFALRLCKTVSLKFEHLEIVFCEKLPTQNCSVCTLTFFWWISDFVFICWEPPSNSCFCDSLSRCSGRKHGGVPIHRGAQCLAGCWGDELWSQVLAIFERQSTTKTFYVWKTIKYPQGTHTAQQKHFAETGITRTACSAFHCSGMLSRRAERRQASLWMDLVGYAEL